MKSEYSGLSIEGLRVGEWMETFRGVKFYPQDPLPGEILIEDIAHALSNLCRFGGHSDAFYSISQHSVLVSELVPREMKLTALLHDASEAYIGDVIRPIKPYLPEYIAFEHRIMTAISIRFGLKWPMPKEVKEADNLALAIEKRCFKKMSTQKWDVDELDTTKSMQIIPLMPIEAERLFLSRFEALVHE